MTGADSDCGSAPLSRPGCLCHVASAEACLAPAKLSSHDLPWAHSQLLPQRIVPCREGRAYRSSLRMTAQARVALGVSRDGHGMEDTGTDSRGRSMDHLSGQCPDHNHHFLLLLRHRCRPRLGLRQDLEPGAHLAQQQGILRPRGVCCGASILQGLVPAPRSKCWGRAVFCPWKELILAEFS